MKTLILFLAILAFFAQSGFAQEPDLAKYFNQNNLTGTLIISSLDDSTTYVYNKTRAEKRYIPASTFKIPNTLIALQEGVYHENDTFYWDNTQYSIAEWNSNQTLLSAFKVSCVWCYQQLARKLSLPIYEAWLQKMNYGNMKTGPILDEFWLNGDIRINAYEQIAFLRNFYTHNLPISEKNIELVKSIMLADQTPEYKFYGKTGWAIRVEDNVGWYVGFIETATGVWIFACNIDMPTNKNAPHRKAAVYAGLKQAGIIKEE